MEYTNDIKTFIKFTILFLTPLVIGVGIGVFFAVYVGELQSLTRIVDKQARGEEEYIFARQIIECETAKYKYLSVMRQRPEILAVGSSRVLELRKAMFDDAGTFYNAGSLIGGLNDLVDFIEVLPKEYTPKVMILGLDTWWFDVKHSNERNLLGELSKQEEIFNWKAYLYAGRHIFSELVKNPRYIANIIRGADPFDSQKALGFDALEHGNGFRDDGSRRYAVYIREMRKSMVYMDREESPFVERIQNGYNPFSFDSDFDKTSLDVLDKFLAKSKERGIQVIGVTPPFSSELYNVMANSYYAPLLRAFKEQIPPVFAKRGFMYFDFLDVASLDMKDVYMLDGVHPTETGAAKMLAGMLEEVCKKDIIKDCQEMRENLLKVLNDSQTTPAEMNFDTF